MTGIRDYAPSLKAAVLPGLAADWLQARRQGLTVPQWRAAQSARLELLPSLDVLRRGLVLDVGANIGDWTAAVLCVEPSATVIAVEPGDTPRSQLERRFAADHRVTIDTRAITDTLGRCDFNVTKHSHNASLRVPQPGMDRLYGSGWAVADVVTVETTTIDDLAHGREVGLLKIDAQGAEREVLAGAEATLMRTGAILLEVTFVRHYAGDASFPWLHEHLTQRGFVLTGLSRPFMSQRHTVLWCDACYTPSDEVNVDLPGDARLT